MSTTFTGYTDAFAPVPERAPSDDALSLKFERLIRKLKRKNKKMKRKIKEQRAAEAQRIAEAERVAEAQRIAEAERAAEEAAKKEKREDEAPFFTKVKDAIIKAIPSILTAVAMFFTRKFFSHKKECKCAQE